jgi:hypothetical protein
MSWLYPPHTAVPRQRFAPANLILRRLQECEKKASSRGPFVPQLNTPVPFTVAAGKTNLWAEQFLGRAVQESVLDLMSLGRFLFLPWAVDSRVRAACPIFSTACPSRGKIRASFLPQESEWFYWNHLPKSRC